MCIRDRMYANWITTKKFKKDKNIENVNEIIDNFTSLPIQQFWKQTYAKAYTVLNELYSGRKDNWDDGDNIVVGEITEFKCLLEKPVSEGNDKWISFTVSECPKFVGYHPSKNLGENSYYNRLKIYLTKEDDIYHKVYADYKDVAEKINNRNEARRKYQNGIRELTNKCTTVHRMLDVEPSMETFVPPEKIQAMHIKMTRAKVAEHIEENIEFDSSLTKQVALTSKLMGA